MGAPGASTLEGFELALSVVTVKPEDRVSTRQIPTGAAIGIARV